MQNRIVIPKNINRGYIELYLDKQWDSKIANDKLDEYMHSITAFAATTQAAVANVHFSVDHISVACGSHNNSNYDSQIVLLIATSSQSDPDKFKDTMKNYTKLLIPAFDCTDAMFSMSPNIPTYIYDNCK